MPCSEDTLAVSPSKRPRPAEEGGLRLRFVRLSEHATAPTKGSARAAGYDLYSAYDYTIPPMEKTLVKTDIQIALPSGCYGRVALRRLTLAQEVLTVRKTEKNSSTFRLGCKTLYRRRRCAADRQWVWRAIQDDLSELRSACSQFRVGDSGVIDEDYRGNLGVVLFNFGKEKFRRYVKYIWSHRCIKKGDRIAQLICERIFYPEIEEVQVSIIKTE
ncbi:hypothetical protein QTO34_019708 [Cnephaeus nilssonii]|uniref:Deoxyuridine 5'-triphosphate nucleotidohydrolase n=1 Tax=Cnephaeus nilssonii TaxID=3371016 RepID=A0AA40HXX4_CNENI|nr:hypothetical protein QTO34_019708 [Eptesicus nilssonii]